MTYVPDTRKFPGQQCQDEKINQAFKNLHHRLVDEVIGFCKAYGISIDEFTLKADCLEDSIKVGSWQSCTDSGLTFSKFSENYKKAFWDMDSDYLKDKTNKDLDMLAYSEEPFLFSM